jgi:hypothetical protein
MKNTYILPTDKPSRLWINNLLQGKLELSKDVLVGSNTAQNIYITSDEKIKEGENCITFGSDKCKGQLDTFQSNVMYSRKPYKIILTTDQDLIADGVQAIDDNFLEWFVQNPSCEGVEFSYGVLKPFQSTEKGYMIHLPDNGGVVEPKQETLEEFANNYSKHPFVITGVLIGAKWQQEQDKNKYSEEEVLKMLEYAVHESRMQDDKTEDYIVNETIFEFKNK